MYQPHLHHQQLHLNHQSQQNHDQQYPNATLKGEEPKESFEILLDLCIIIYVSLWRDNYIIILKSHMDNSMLNTFFDLEECNIFYILHTYD